MAGSEAQGFKERPQRKGKKYKAKKVSAEGGPSKAAAAAKKVPKAVWPGAVSDAPPLEANAPKPGLYSSSKDGAVPGELLGITADPRWEDLSQEEMRAQYLELDRARHPPPVEDAKGEDGESADGGGGQSEDEVGEEEDADPEQREWRKRGRQQRERLQQLEVEQEVRQKMCAAAMAVLTAQLWHAGRAAVQDAIAAASYVRHCSRSATTVSPTAAGSSPLDTMRDDELPPVLRLLWNAYAEAGESTADLLRVGGGAGDGTASDAEGVGGGEAALHRAVRSAVQVASRVPAPLHVVGFSSAVKTAMHSRVLNPGIVHWLGCRDPATGDSRPWSNPGGAKEASPQVVVTMSTVQSGEPSHVTGHNEFARQTCMTRDQADGWYCLDFQQMAVSPSGYTIRYGNSDGSCSCPRSWELQGSHDGLAFEPIKVHKDDPALNCDYAMGSWDLPPPAFAAGMPAFRYLRLQMKPEGSKSKKNYFALNGFEVFGAVFPAEEAGVVNGAGGWSPDAAGGVVAAAAVKAPAHPPPVGAFSLGGAGPPRASAFSFGGAGPPASAAGGGFAPAAAGGRAKPEAAPKMVLFSGAFPAERAGEMKVKAVAAAGKFRCLDPNGVAYRRSMSMGDRFTGCRGPDHHEVVVATLVDGGKWLQLAEPAADGTVLFLPLHSAAARSFEALDGELGADHVRAGTKVWHGRTYHETAVAEGLPRASGAEPDGVYYWELQASSELSGALAVGVAFVANPLGPIGLDSGLGHDKYGWGYRAEGKTRHDSMLVQYGKAWKPLDVIGVELDFTEAGALRAGRKRGTLKFFQNGEDLGVAFDGLLATLSSLAQLQGKSHLDPAHANFAPALSLHGEKDTLTLLPTPESKQHVAAAKAAGAAAAMGAGTASAAAAGALASCTVLAAPGHGRIAGRAAAKALLRQVQARACFLLHLRSATPLPDGLCRPDGRRGPEPGERAAAAGERPAQQEQDSMEESGMDESGDTGAAAPAGVGRARPSPAAEAEPAERGGQPPPKRAPSAAARVGGGGPRLDRSFSVMSPRDIADASKPKLPPASPTGVAKEGGSPRADPRVAASSGAPPAAAAAAAAAAAGGGGVRGRGQRR
jgi:hypothetical protein